MKVVALLSWYDEPTEWLHECVTRAAQVADHLIAVDGPYVQFPGAKPSSPPGQADAITSAGHDAGIPVTLDRPGRPWPSEVAKRDHMFRLAERLDSDWLFRIDADEFVESPSDLRDLLASTTRHVAEATLWHPDRDYITPLRVLFRALPGLTISHAHNLVTCIVEGRRLFLAGDSGTYDLEPAEHLPGLRIEHRTGRRDSGRQAAKQTYYKIMRRIETTMPLEQETHGMKIRMKIQITGLRNGVRWPAAGGVVDLPDREGAKLCANGFAEPVVEDRVEKAVAPPAEKRGPGRPRKDAS